MNQTNGQTNYLEELVGFERLHTVKKYAEYFLQNNREVMDQSNINELETALKYFDLSYVNEWQKPVDLPTVYTLTDFQVPALRRLSEKTINSWKADLDRYGTVACCRTIEELELCYYRSRIFIYDYGFTYNRNTQPNYGANMNTWATLLKRINTEYIEQPYSYDIDGEVSDDIELEENRYVDLIFPDEWHVALSNNVEQLARYSKYSTPSDLKNIIDTALMNTLPTEIKYL